MARPPAIRRHRIPNELINYSNLYFYSRMSVLLLPIRRHGLAEVVVVMVASLPASYYLQYISRSFPGQARAYFR